MRRTVVLLAVSAACGRFDFERRSDGGAGDGAHDVTADAVISGLVHGWRFEDGAGTSAMDAIGGTTAMLLGNATWTTGRSGGALPVDGVNSWAQASLGLGTGAVTITAWIYPRSDGASGAATVVSEEDLGGVTLFECERNHLAAGDDMICADSTSNAPYAETAVPIALNGWTHFAMTRTAAGLFTIYVDGAPSGTAHQDGGPTVPGGTVLYMGARDNLDDRFDGYLDEVRVYDRELGPDEVGVLYAQGC